MKAKATASNGLIQNVTGTKTEIIETCKSISLSNSCDVEVLFENGDYNVVCYESSPNGKGGINWQITVE